MWPLIPHPGRAGTAASQEEEEEVGTLASGCFPDEIKKSSNLVQRRRLRPVMFSFSTWIQDLILNMLFCDNNF